MGSNALALGLCQSFLTRFEAFCEANHEAFRRAEPFPYAVADSLFDDRLIERILREYPRRDNPIWQRYDDSDMTSGRFLIALSRLTGIPNLISDPYLMGGGVSSVYRGGMLDIHCYGNLRDAIAIHRRLNATSIPAGRKAGEDSSSSGTGRWRNASRRWCRSTTGSSCS